MKKVSSYNVCILVSRNFCFFQFVVAFISYLLLRESLIEILIKVFLTTFEVMTTRVHRIEMFCARDRIVERLCFTERRVLVTLAFRKTIGVCLSDFKYG